MHGRDDCTKKKRHKCEHYIKINLEELGWKNVSWIHLVKPRGQWWAFVNRVLNPEVS
jgi:hypothetical protein